MRLNLFQVEGVVYRTLRVPINVDAKKISTKYAKGVFHLTLAKKEEDKEKRQCNEFRKIYFKSSRSNY